MFVRSFARLAVVLIVVVAGFAVIIPLVAAQPSGREIHQLRQPRSAGSVPQPQVIATLQLTRGLGIRPVAITLNPATGYLYIANRESDSVSILSGTQLIKNVPVGDEPWSIGTNPMTGLVYVHNIGDRTISVLSGTQVVNVIPNIGGGSIGVQPNTGYIYIDDGSWIGVLTGTQFITWVTGLPNNSAYLPMQFAADPRHDYMYALDDRGVMVLSGTAAITIHNLSRAQGALTFDDMTGYAYAAVTDSLTIISPTQCVEDIPLTPTLTYAFAVARDPASGHVYVGGDPVIQVVSGTQTIAVISTTLPTRQIIIDAIDHYVYAIDTYNRQATVISGTTVITTIVLHSTDDTEWSWQSRAAFNPATDDVYVLNSRANSVNIVSGLHSIARVEGGVSFKRTQSNPATGYVYAAVRGIEGVIVLSDTRIVTTVPTDKQPQDISINPVTGYVYVPTFRDRPYQADVQVLSGTEVITAMAFDLNTGAFQPLAVGVNSNTGYVYVAGQVNYYYGLVHIFSGTQAVGSTCGECFPYNSFWAIAVNPTNGYVYVANQWHQFLSVLSQTHFIGSVWGGDGPALQVNPATGYVYGELAGGWLGIVADTRSITDFAVGNEVGAIGVNPANGYAYVTDIVSDYVTILSGADVIATRATGRDPSAIAVDAERGYVYIANAASDDVTVMSGTEVVMTIPVGAGPAVIEVNPATGLVYVGNEGDQSISIIGLPRPRYFLPLVQKGG